MRIIPRQIVSADIVYRGVLIVVRQDLRTARPTGWVQLNFWVSDVKAVQEEIERVYRASSIAQLAEADRSKIVRFRFKPDVMRGRSKGLLALKSLDRRGFMIGFDQANEFVSTITFQPKEHTMKLSARNQFQGTVSRITEGQAMAEVAVKVGNLEFIAAITEGSVKNMGLKLNDSVTVAVKATEVMIGK